MTTEVFIPDTELEKAYEAMKLGERITLFTIPAKNMILKMERDETRNGLVIVYEDFSGTPATLSVGAANDH